MSDRLIDNQDLRLSDAINQVIPYSSAARLAVGYFFISGFEAVAEPLCSLDKVQLLIGSTTNRRTIEELALGYRRRELIEEQLRKERFANVEDVLNGTVSAIRQQVSELQPGEREERTITTLADLIARDKKVAYSEASR